MEKKTFLPSLMLLALFCLNSVKRATWVVVNQREIISPVNSTKRGRLAEEKLERERGCWLASTVCRAACGNRPAELPPVGPLGAHVEADGRFPRKSF